MQKSAKYDFWELSNILERNIQFKKEGTIFTEQEVKLAAENYIINTKNDI